MLYLARNSTGFERIARLALARCLAFIIDACVPIGWPGRSACSVAVSIACTAMEGFCPARAMVGRTPVARGA